MSSASPSLSSAARNRHPPDHLHLACGWGHRDGDCSLGPTAAVVLLRASSPDPTTVSVSELEMGLTRRLRMDGDFDELEFLPRYDVHLLRCQQAPASELVTIFGITEDQCHRRCPTANDNDDEDTVRHRGGPCMVLISSYEPVLSRTSDSGTIPTPKKAPRGPHSDWIRPSAVGNQGQRRPWLGDSNCETNVTSLWWVDLRAVQQQEEEGDVVSGRSFLDTQSGVVHLLRSLLTSSHEASPWVGGSGGVDDVDDGGLAECTMEPHFLPDIVVVALKHIPPVLRDFRVSDVAPSWFLHGIAQLEDLEPPGDLFHQQEGEGRSCDGKLPPPRCHHDDDTIAPAMLVIYKKLAPRKFLSFAQPKETREESISGCLWEAHVAMDDEGGDADHGIDGKCDQNGKGTETKDKKEEEEEGCRALDSYRLVCPPYLNLEVEYPNTTLSQLFSRESIRIFTKDAMAIPQWTPWPETAHYGVRRTATGDSGGSGPSTTPPWTVFPLCHCFPATRPENLTWVEATRAHVPRTCRLLEDLVGTRYLRTALFSQLAPHSVLEAHTGWADLANHVLRLHVPLVVPGGDHDLCGTWVDGCVETHSVGRPLLFDDSKIHRAFNYSDSPRLVLIVDLVRPEHLPLGYASGGHSEELDAFIAQMSVPK